MAQDVLQREEGGYRRKPTEQNRKVGLSERLWHDDRELMDRKRVQASRFGMASVVLYVACALSYVMAFQGYPSQYGWIEPLWVVQLWLAALFGIIAGRKGSKWWFAMPMLCVLTVGAGLWISSMIP